MAKTGLVTYFKQVRQELNKVTWPTRKETIQTTIMVFIMVTIMSLFLFLTDQVVAFFIQLILGLGR